SERLCGLEVDHQLIFRWRLHRQIGRRLALEDAIDIAGRTPALVDEIRSIGNQAARVGEATFVVDCGQLVPGCERDDQVAMKRRRRAPGHDQAVVRTPGELCDAMLDPAGIMEIEWA